jgi:hypothetical protein
MNRTSEALANQIETLEKIVVEMKSKTDPRTIDVLAREAICTSQAIKDLSYLAAHQSAVPS